MPHKILLAAGGTGGHIMPSIAFGEYLREHGWETAWLSGSRPLEREIYAAHGIDAKSIAFEGSPLGVSGMRSLKRWGQLFSSYFESRRILREERAQACVVFGGYLSLPVMLAARSLKIPVLLHEQNAVAGKVTRLAAKHGVKIACAWEECRGIPKEKMAYTGMPLRNIELFDRKKAQAELLGKPLPDGERLIVILGGSLGSGGLKKMLHGAQSMVKSTSYRILCMGIKEADRPFAEALVHDAVWDMAPIYSAADIVVCRAGASTLAELLVLNVPSVVVPWMQSADNHQLGNAELFSKLTGAPLYIEGSPGDEFLSALSSAPERRTSGDLSAGSKNLEALLHSLFDGKGNL